jgi:opacity protein-like surface antigen
MPIRFLRAASVAIVLTVCAPPLFAQTDPPPTPTPVETPAGRLTGIEAMTSTVMQEGQSSFSGLAVRLRINPKMLVEQIEVMPTIEYWRNSNSIQTYDIRTVRKDATIGIDGRWTFSKETFKPYVGVGWALHFLSTRVDAPTFGLQQATDSVTKGGIAFLGGASFALTGKFSNFLDVKYHHVTDYRQLKINFGIGYNF